MPYIIFTYNIIEHFFFKWSAILLATVVQLWRDFACSSLSVQIRYEQDREREGEGDENSHNKKQSIENKEAKE